MHLFSYFLYGIVSGIAELLPISSFAHAQLFRECCGASGRNGLHDLFVHIAVLAAVFYIYKTTIQPQRSGRYQARYGNAESRLRKTAMIPLLVSVIFYPIVASWGSSLLLICVFLLINGFVLFIPSRMLRGNKGATAMTGFDSLLIGTGAAFGVFPGVSRVAGTLGFAMARGADSANSFRWAVTLSIPGVLLLIVSDLIALGAQAGYSASFFGVILSMIGAVAGVFAGYSIMRFLSAKAGFFRFSYYCWGAALFAFILYLTV